MALTQRHSHKINIVNAENQHELLNLKKQETKVIQVISDCSEQKRFGNITLKLNINGVESATGEQFSIFLRSWYSSIRLLHCFACLLVVVAALCPLPPPLPVSVPSPRPPLPTHSIFRHKVNISRLVHLRLKT
jgi:hypothetical protein